MSARNTTDFVPIMSTASIRSAATVAVVAMGLRLSQNLIGSCFTMNSTVLILTSVKTKTSAQKSLFVKILMEASSVNVIQDSTVIFAKTSTNVTKPALVIHMQHV